jgi:hypothetical protein
MLGSASPRLPDLVKGRYGGNEKGRDYCGTTLKMPLALDT